MNKKTSIVFAFFNPQNSARNPKNNLQQAAFLHDYQHRTLTFCYNSLLTFPKILPLPLMPDVRL